MPTHDELVALRERVRNAKKGDPALDCDLYNAFPQFESSFAFRHTDGEYYKKDDAPRPNTWGPFPLDEYTASLDAAVALCGRLLPGWEWTLEHGGYAKPYVANLKENSADEVFIGAGETGPLAFIEALLSALIAQQDVADAQPA